MINAASRKKNYRKDSWFKRKTYIIKKSDHTNRHLLRPSIETFGKKRKAEILKEEAWRQEVAARKRVRRPNEKKSLNHTTKISTKKKQSDHNGANCIPKDRFWKMFSEVSKTIQFPENREPRYKQPETFLGKVTSYPTSFAGEYLSKPSTAKNTFTLKSYLRNFPLI